MNFERAVNENSEIHGFGQRPSRRQAKPIESSKIELALPVKVWQ